MSEEAQITVGITIMPGARKQDIEATLDTFQTLLDELPKDEDIIEFYEGLQIEVYPPTKNEGEKFEFFSTWTSGFSMGFTNHYFWLDGEVHDTEDGHDHPYLED